MSGTYLQGENNHTPTLSDSPDHNDDTLTVDFSAIGIPTTPNIFAAKAENDSPDCTGIKCGDVVLWKSASQKPVSL